MGLKIGEHALLKRLKLLSRPEIHILIFDTLTSAKLCGDAIAVVPNVLRCVFAELSTKRKNWENVRRLILEDLNYDHNW